MVEKALAAIESDARKRLAAITLAGGEGGVRGPRLAAQTRFYGVRLRLIRRVPATKNVNAKAIKSASIVIFCALCVSTRNISDVLPTMALSATSSQRR